MVIDGVIEIIDKMHELPAITLGDVALITYVSFACGLITNDLVHFIIYIFKKFLSRKKEK